MSNSEIILPLIRKLEKFIELSQEEKCALQEAAGPIRTYGGRQNLVRDSNQGHGVSVIVSGFACQHITLPDGRRQIVSYFLPGDMCGSQILILRSMDFAISTLTSSSVVTLSREAILDVTSRYPQLARAFWWNALVDEQIGRQWLVNIGQRTAAERIAHLFCEIHVRLQSGEHATSVRYELPVTQSELADTLALSTVHVNRTLKELRSAGLVSMSKRTVIIHDLSGLRALAMFDAGYLHPNGPDSISRLVTHAGSAHGIALPMMPAPAARDRSLPS